MGKKERAKAKKAAKKAKQLAAAAAKATHASANEAHPQVNAAAAKLYKEFSASLAKAHKTAPEPLDILRMKYSMMGKEKWWYIMDECIAQAAKELTENNYVV